MKKNIRKVNNKITVTRKMKKKINEKWDDNSDKYGVVEEHGPKTLIFGRTDGRVYCRL